MESDFIAYFTNHISEFKLILITLSLIAFSVSDFKKRSIKMLSALLFLLIAVSFFMSNYDENSKFFLENTTYLLIFIALVSVFTFIGMIGIGDLFVLTSVMLLTPYEFLDGIMISTLLTNSLLFYLLVFPYNLIRNFLDSRKNNIFEGINETNLNKLKALLLAHRSKKGNYGFLLQNNTHFNFKFKNVNRTQFNEKIGVWIIPAYPFIPFILLGFVAQLFIGDLLGIGDYLNWKFR